MEKYLPNSQNYQKTPFTANTQNIFFSRYLQKV